MRVTIHDGVRFYEGHPTFCTEIKPVRVEIGGIISQAQLKTLKDVKALLAKRACSAGGNAIIDFQYGQKSVGWLRSLLQLDDVNWYGYGTIAKVAETDANRKER